MDPGFRGEVAEFYAQWRRGYPPAVIDVLVDAFGLSGDDIVVDLGCGTGQLALPLAPRVRAVLGVDPEPDMLRLARQKGPANANWMIGSDADIPALVALLGGTVGAVTIGQALHWMRPERLFPAVRPLLRDGGGVAVVTNGVPLWQQDAGWSRALRRHLEGWLNISLTRTCGTDADSQRRYRGDLTAAGFEVSVRNADYSAEIDLEYIIGNVYSALPAERIPTPVERSRFAARLGEVLRPYQPFVEQVRVVMLIATA